MRGLNFDSKQFFDSVFREAVDRNRETKSSPGLFRKDYHRTIGLYLNLGTDSLWEEIPVRVYSEEENNTFETAEDFLQRIKQKNPVFESCLKDQLHQSGVFASGTAAVFGILRTLGLYYVDRRTEYSIQVTEEAMFITEKIYFAGVGLIPIEYCRTYGAEASNKRIELAQKYITKNCKQLDELNLHYALPFSFEVYYKVREGNEKDSAPVIAMRATQAHSPMSQQVSLKRFIEVLKKIFLLCLAKKFDARVELLADFANQSVDIPNSRCYTL